MITFETGLDLRKIISLKPFFFFYHPAPKKRIFSGHELLLGFVQEKNGFSVETNLPEMEGLIERTIRHCFGLNEDLSEFYEMVSSDPLLGEHHESITGTTILSAYTPYEAVVGGIASQNTTFSRYMHFMQALDSVAFNPSKINEGFLKKNGFGYKTRFILELPRAPDLTKLNEYLGVGDYTQKLLSIFQDRNFSSFYCDVLIRKIVCENYEQVSSDEELKDFAKSRWGKWRGLMEVYLQKFVCDLKTPVQQATRPSAQDLRQERKQKSG